MSEILHRCARTLSRNITKATKNPLHRVFIQVESSGARSYHRNVGSTASATSIPTFATSVKILFVQSQCQPLLLINRALQTTSVLGTSKDVVVPAFADSVSEGDVKWEKQVGDAVVEDETVCEIETDKAGFTGLFVGSSEAGEKSFKKAMLPIQTSIAVPSPGKGVIEELYVEDGATVKPGMKLFRIKIGG